MVGITANGQRTGESNIDTVFGFTQSCNNIQCLLLVAGKSGYKER